jgi:hypothetical protein
MGVARSKPKSFSEALEIVLQKQPRHLKPAIKILKETKVSTEINTQICNTFSSWLKTCIQQNEETFEVVFKGLTAWHTLSDGKLREEVIQMVLELILTSGSLSDLDRQKHFKQFMERCILQVNVPTIWIPILQKLRAKIVEPVLVEWVVNWGRKYTGDKGWEQLVNGWVEGVKIQTEIKGQTCHMAMEP